MSRAITTESGEGCPGGLKTPPMTGPCAKVAYAQHPDGLWYPATQTQLDTKVPGTHGILGHGPIADAAAGAVGGIESVGQFLGKLGDPHTWVRVGEVLVGTILLIVGIDTLTKADITGKLAKLGPVA